MDERAFQVDLVGLVELLSEHLYSGPKVFIRELLQNGVDAVTARHATGDAGGGAISLEVVTGSAPGEPATLVVEDDGLGLTLAEAETFLATIGASSKRGRDALEDTREAFIGQFGIGLLSCFLVSDEVVVLTRSARPGGPHPVVEWRGRSDGTFAIREVEGDRTPGTTVYVRARAGAGEWFDPAVVEEIAAMYGTLLPYPVTVRCGERSKVITIGDLPWRWSLSPDDRVATWVNYGQDTLETRVLDAFPISSPTGGVDGLAFVLPGSGHAMARQHHRVYVKRMLLSDAVDQLLPDWAFFVRCIVNTDKLRPTASRESLHEDAILTATREELGLSLRGHMIGLAVSDPLRLENIVRTHSHSMKALAATDEEFLSIIADWLPFETTDGRMTLGQFRARHGSIRFTESVDTFRQIAQVARARGVGVINGGYTYDAAVLMRASHARRELDISVIDAAEMVHELEPVGDDQAEVAAAFLEAARGVLRTYECEVDVRRFEPFSLPALYTSDDDARYERTIDQARAIADPLFASVLGSIGPVVSNRPTMCFNASNPLVAKLFGLASSEVVSRAVEVLYVQALLLGHHPLRADELAVLNTSVLGLIELAADASPGDELGPPR